jgi:ketosteroid isomerase-like protein
VSEDRVEWLKALYQAFIRRDLPFIYDMVSEDIELTQSELLPWGGRFWGLDGLRQFFVGLFEYVDSRVEPRQFVQAGDRVAVIARLHGHVKANNQPFDLTAIHTWTFRDQKLVRLDILIDTPQMLAALEA